MIDIFCHWVPRVFGAAALKASTHSQHMLERALAMPVMVDLDRRLQLMDNSTPATGKRRAWSRHCWRR